MPTTPNTPAWQALSQHFQQDIACQPLKRLFAAGGEARFAELSWQAQSMLLDISKQRLQTKTLTLLQNLATERGLKEAIESLFEGEVVNQSELRPALHTALRQTTKPFPKVDGEDTQGLVEDNLANMQGIVEKVHAGQWLGYSGQPINTIVNIGVGALMWGPIWCAMLWMNLR